MTDGKWNQPDSDSVTLGPDLVTLGSDSLASTLTRKKDLQKFVSEFPDRSFHEPTDKERISLSRASAAVWTWLNGIPDKEAEVPLETVEKVLECLKINHQIKWLLTA
jgi:hypothetical protein